MTVSPSASIARTIERGDGAGRNDDVTEAPPLFVVEFKSVINVPPCANIALLNAYIKSYIVVDVTKINDKERQYLRLSEDINTHVKNRCNYDRIIWNSYRDFRINPPIGGYICMELYHTVNSPSSSPVTASSASPSGPSSYIGNAFLGSNDNSDTYIGRAYVPIIDLINNNGNTILQYSLKVDSKTTASVSGNNNRSSTGRNSSSDAMNQCILAVRRGVLSTPTAPIYKTIFLIRHGESRWNEAQESGNVIGLLHYDHGLTKKGIDQANDLHNRWTNACHVSMSNTCTDTTVPGLTKGAILHPHVPYLKQTLIRPSIHQMLSFTEITASSSSSSSLRGLSAASTASTASLIDVFDDGEIEDKEERVLSSDVPALIKECMQTDGSDYCNISSNCSNKNTDDCKYDHDAVIAATASTSDSNIKNNMLNVTKRIRRSITSLTSSVTSNFNQLTRASKQDSCDSIGGTGGATSMSSTVSVSSRLPSSKRKARRDYYRELFIESDRVYSSPLTRAIETSVVALQTHPAMYKPGAFRLYSVIREFKGIGGLDAVGIAYGDAEIKKHVQDELNGTIDDNKSMGILSSSSRILSHMDVYDAGCTWWTNVSDVDTRYEQEIRLVEFSTFVRLCDDDSPIFVGHSLFFRNFCSKRISTFLARNRPMLTSNMRQNKLGNGTLIAVTILFNDIDNGCSDCTIIDADLIFGGSFFGGDNFDDHERERDSVMPDLEEVNVYKLQEDVRSASIISAASSGKKDNSNRDKCTIM